jgi:hypothetical protein
MHMTVDWKTVDGSTGDGNSTTSNTDTIKTDKPIPQPPRGSRTDSKKSGRQSEAGALPSTFASARTQSLHRCNQTGKQTRGPSRRGEGLCGYRQARHGLRAASASVALAPMTRRRLSTTCNNSRAKFVIAYCRASCSHRRGVDRCPNTITIAFPLWQLRLAADCG